MKKILFITTLTCLFYIQVKGQNLITADSLTKQTPDNVVPPKIVEEKGPEARQTFTKTDSLGNLSVLSVLSDEVRITIHSNDSLKNNNAFLKRSTHTSQHDYLVMGQMVTKEGLYRLSESFFNKAIDSSSYRRLYSETLQYTIDLITEQIDLEDSKTEQIKAETERSKIEVEKLKLELEILKIEKGIYSDRKEITIPKPVEESEIQK